MNLNPVNAGMKNVASLPMRAALGTSMLYHGYSKLHPAKKEGAVKMMDALEIKPPRFWAFALGASEIFGGLSALLGIGTRIGALAVLVTQSVAVYKVHLDKGFDNTKGGYEFNLALMGIAAALLFAGPGVISTHEAIERRLQRKTRRRLFFGGPKKATSLVKLIK